MRSSSNSSSSPAGTGGGDFLGGDKMSFTFFRLLPMVDEIEDVEVI